MWVIASSLLLGLVGIVGARVGLDRLAADDGARDPHVYWVIGTIALLPAWLVPLIALLGRTPALRPEVVSKVLWVVSTAAAFIGVIITEAAIRRAVASSTGPSPARAWGLGVLAFVPAWTVALVGYAAR